MNTAMKTPTFLLSGSLIFVSVCAQAQATEEVPRIEKNISISSADPETERLKKELKAPDRASFQSEDEYLKAKEEWAAKNKAAYDKMIRPKDD